MRFYSFIAQVIRLEDTGLEKLYSYAAWLARLLPSRDVPPEIEITEDMLRLQAFKVEQKEQGNASLSPGDRATLKAISEFGAKPYTEDEKKELSEIVKAFNDRHGTTFTEDDMIRFEQVNREIVDDDMAEMLRNNPPDVVYAAFATPSFKAQYACSSVTMKCGISCLRMPKREIRPPGIFLVERCVAGRETPPQ